MCIRDSFVTTYGFTRINGNTITTGKIVTSDGECYLDLDGNKFRIGDATSSIDWNVTAKNQLTLRNVKLLSDSGDLSDLGVYRGIWNAQYIYIIKGMKLVIHPMDQLVPIVILILHQVKVIYQ